MSDPPPPEPYTMERRLCDDAGIVSRLVMDPPNWLAPGTTYLGQLNNLRAHTGLAPVKEEFQCTGSAHLAGEHIRCTSPAHEHEQKVVRLTMPIGRVVAQIIRVYGYEEIKAELERQRPSD